WGIAHGKLSWHRKARALRANSFLCNPTGRAHALARRGSGVAAARAREDREPDTMKDLESLALRVEAGQRRVLGPTLLPRQERWLTCESPDELVGYIHQLQIRGAPLLGVASSVALALFGERGATQKEIIAAGEKLRRARPTAVNLMHGVDRTLKNLH